MLAEGEGANWYLTFGSYEPPSIS